VWFVCVWCVCEVCVVYVCVVCVQRCLYYIQLTLILLKCRIE
jgi:hypothetical protein